MRAFLTHIATQDDATRKRWFIILTTGGGVLVVMIWLLVINLVDLGPITGKKPVVVAEESQASSFSALRGSIAGAWRTTKEALSGAIIEFERSAPIASSTETTTSTPANN